MNRLLVVVLDEKLFIVNANLVLDKTATICNCGKFSKRECTIVDFTILQVTGAGQFEVYKESPRALRIMQRARDQLSKTCDNQGCGLNQQAVVFDTVQDEEWYQHHVAIPTT